MVKHNTKPTMKTPESAKGEGPVAANLRRCAELAEYSTSMKKLMERFPEARLIADATEDRMLLVTDQDVASGLPKNPSACAVAQCVRRQGLGGMIGRQFAYLIDGHLVTRYRLGKDAQTRTAVFDDRGTMTPGPVLLSAPPPSQRLASMKSAAKQSSSKRKILPKTRSGRHLRKRFDAVRHSISTNMFRSWDQA